MAHTEQQFFIFQTRRRFPLHFKGGTVLEVGSYNVNGSVREYFEEPALYVGLDLAPGKDVDVVCHGADYKSTALFDVVISAETFEHDFRWEDTFNNMHKLCRVGGLVIFTCAANKRHEHGTPRTTPQDSALATEYYKNLNAQDFEEYFDLRGWFSWYTWEARENDLYFWGVKR